MDGRAVEILDNSWRHWADLRPPGTLYSGGGGRKEKVAARSLFMHQDAFEISRRKCMRSIKEMKNYKNGNKEIFISIYKYIVRNY